MKKGRELRHRLRNAAAKSLSSGAYKAKTIPDKKNRYKRKNKNLSDNFEEGEPVPELDPVEPSNVRTFRVVDNASAPKAPDGREVSELLQGGIDMFLEEVKTNTSGFVVLIFDSGSQSFRTIIAGEIDPTLTLGTLQLVQHDILKSIV